MLVRTIIHAQEPERNTFCVKCFAYRYCIVKRICGIMPQKGIRLQAKAYFLPPETDQAKENDHGCKKRHSFGS